MKNCNASMKRHYHNPQIPRHQHHHTFLHLGVRIGILVNFQMEPTRADTPEALPIDPVEMFSNTSRRKIKKYISIVKKVNYRSLTGQELGLHVHQHLGTVTLLCWNIHNTTGCYKNFIVRDNVDCDVSMQIWHMYRNGGPVGACKCCYSNVYASPRDLGKPYIYMDDQVVVNHSLSDKLYVSWDKIECICQCPDLSLWGISGTTPMTSSCLKNSTMTVFPPTFGRSNDLLKENRLALIVRMKLHEA